MKHLISNYILLVLLFFISCVNKNDEYEIKSISCSFVKAIIFKDSTFINKKIDRNSIVKFLKKKFKAEEKLITEENLENILFLKYSYLKIHSENLSLIKRKIKCSDFTIKLHKRNRNKDIILVDWENPFDKKKRDTIILTYTKINNELKITEISW